MTRHGLFKHYWWIALLVWAAGGIGAVFFFTTAERITLIGSITAAALGFCYFVQRQKLAETRLFKDLFTDFNRRYGAINDRLVGLMDSDEPLNPSDRQTIVDYFNLCAEEYLFFSEGYIHQAVWKSWCVGMLSYLDHEPYQSVWRKESETNSYYGLSLNAIRQGAG